jgi:hypothetical protein
MTSQEKASSWKWFPPDLLILSGVPIFAVALFSTWLLNLRGSDWIVAYAGSLVMSLVGAVMIFLAKLPLYRKRLYFTTGARLLSDSSRLLYHRGLRLSLVGITLSIILIAVSFLWR